MKEEWEKEILPELTSDNIPIKPQRVIREIRNAIGRNDIVTGDAGNNVLWLSTYFPVYSPRTIFGPSGFGTMGFGFPAAMGAKLALPDRNAVAVSGDGGFMMVMQDLETAVRCEIPVVVVILNDYSLGAIKHLQELSYEGCYGVQHRNPDFAELSVAFAAAGEKIEAPNDLAPALKRAIEADVPYVLDVIIDKEEKTPVLKAFSR